MKRLTFLILILLFLGGVCSATDHYYVSQDGLENDMNTWLGAMKTITAALNKVKVDSTDAIVEVNKGTYSENAYAFNTTWNGIDINIIAFDPEPNNTIWTSENTTYTVYLSGIMNLTLNGLAIRCTYAGDRSVIIGATDVASHLTINRCNIGTIDDPCTGFNRGIYYAPLGNYTGVSTAYTRTLDIENSSKIFGKAGSTSTGNAAYLADINNVTIKYSYIDRSNDTYGSSAPAIFLSNKLVGDIEISNCNIVGTKGGGVASYLDSTTSDANYFKSLTVDNCIFDGNGHAVIVGEYLQSGSFTNITGSGGGLKFGFYDKQSTNPTGIIHVADVNIIKTQIGDMNTGGWGLLFGYGVGAGSSAENCRFTNHVIGFLGKGITAKTVKNSYFYNYVWSNGDAHCIYLRSIQNLTFINNEVYGHGTSAAIVISDDSPPRVTDDINDTDFNIFTNNIIDGTSNNYAVYMVNTAVDCNNKFDFNCYKDGSTNFAYVAGAAKTFATWKAYWADNGANIESQRNDAHSIDHTGGTCDRFIRAAARPKIDGSLAEKGLIRQ